MNDTRKDIHNSNLPVLCRACEARHKGVCGTLNEQQLIKLSKQTKRRVLNSAEKLHNSQSDTESYSNILSGVVKLTKLMSDGRQQIVGLQFAPDLVGRPFSSSSDTLAEAATDIRICSFPRKILETIIAETPELEHRIHEQKIKELDEARDWLLTVGRKTALEKVASFIQYIALHIDPENNATSTQIKIMLPMKRGEIADYLGLTIETVSRQISHLRKIRVIDVPERKTITILDMEKLAAVAG